MPAIFCGRHAIPALKGDFLMKRWWFLLMLASVAAPLSGCVVVPAAPRPTAQAHWVPGHFNAYGFWVRGHLV
jgi:hypothetical protein